MPACHRRGFRSEFESEKTTPDGDHFCRVSHCRGCGQYLLERGPEVHALDANRWEHQVDTWQKEFE